MLNDKQLRELIIKPTLQDLQVYSDDAVHLLLFTCAVESDGGTYLKQTNGSALGIYQMEPATYNDIWQNYVLYKDNLKLLLLNTFNIYRMESEERLIWDLRFATVFAMIHYMRVKEPLPSKKNIVSVMEYYKNYYNKPLGKHSIQECINKYLKFIQSN